MNMATKAPQPAAYERSDVCAVPAASVIVENVVAFEIAAAVVEKYVGTSLGGDQGGDGGDARTGSEASGGVGDRGRGIGDGGDPQLSGPAGLAGGDGPGRIGLPPDPTLSPARGLRPGQPDAPGGGLDPLEHRRGPYEGSRPRNTSTTSRIAQGSLAELQTQIELSGRLDYLTADQASGLMDQTVSLARQLYALRNAS